MADHEKEDAMDELLKSVFYGLSDGIVVVNRLGEPKLLNTSAQRLLGKHAEALNPSLWTDECGCYLPDRNTPYSPDRSPLLRVANGEEIGDELVFVKRSGKSSGKLLSVLTKPLSDNGGSLWGGLVIVRDVSATEDIGRKIELIDRLSRALEQTADSVIITDRVGQIEYVNHAFETTTGFKRTDVLGHTPSVLKSGQHDAEFYQNIWGEIRSGRPYRGTIINKKKTGELYWSEQTITPMKDGNGEITHYVSVLKDITELLEKKEKEVEMRLAREVQQQYYKASVSVPGYDIAGAACPANETGGDYFDFMTMPNDRICIVIGDVCGHGISAALIMAELRAYLRSFAASCTDPGDILTKINHAISEDLDKGRFVTFLLMCLDPKTGQLSYASAGHEPGYLINDSGEIDMVFDSTGPPLGVFPDTTYQTCRSTALNNGQQVLLVTDGVFDSLAGDENEFLAVRAVEYAHGHRHESSQDIAQGLCKISRCESKNDLCQDDVTSVVLKML